MMKLDIGPTELGLLAHMMRKVNKIDSFHIVCQGSVESRPRLCLGLSKKIAARRKFTSSRQAGSQ